MFVIARLSRAMRSLKHLLAFVGELRERGDSLVVLKQDIDTTKPGARRGSAAAGGARARRRGLGLGPGRSQIRRSAPGHGRAGVEGVAQVDERTGFDIDDGYPPVPVTF